MTIVSRQPPSVILVRPQMGENIGAAARAMMNFGLSDLRIVAPRDGWPNAKALEMSANAVHIVEQASLYDTLEEALRDIQVALAATTRSRQLRLPVYTPEQAVENMDSFRTAFVFGQENNGLSNEDVALCHGIVTIPTHPNNPSLNIAQSVVLLAYQWFAKHHSVSTKIECADRASHEEIFHLIKHLDDALDARNFYKTPELKATTKRNLSAIFLRSELSVSEVKMLRGAISILIERDAKK